MSRSTGCDLVLRDLSVERTVTGWENESEFFFYFRLAVETSCTPDARDPSSVADEGPDLATADGRTRGQQPKNLLLFFQTVVRLGGGARLQSDSGGAAHVRDVLESQDTVWGELFDDQGLLLLGSILPRIPRCSGSMFDVYHHEAS